MAKYKYFIGDKEVSAPINSLCATASFAQNIGCDGKKIAPKPTGRNKPCKCGSGKNLKNCCGK